jgi:hypothetical protein
MECKGSQRILVATAHKTAGSSAVSVVGVTMCAVLHPSSLLQVSQDTTFTGVCACDWMHAVSFLYSHDRITCSWPFTETLKTNKLKH